MCFIILHTIRMCVSLCDFATTAYFNLAFVLKILIKVFNTSRVQALK